MRFQCNRENCNRSYVRKEHLLRHLNDHEDRRQYQCHLCQATFNRRDLLNRHKVLSHNEPQTRAVNLSYDERAAGQANEISPDLHVGPGRLSSTLTNQQLPDLFRIQLEENYFRGFHLYWPLLHQRTYRTTRQPTKLVEVVLTAGLWMMGTNESETQAKAQHGKLFQQTTNYLTNLGNDDSATDLQQANLAEFQAILILLILTAYRGPDTLLPAVGKTQRFFRVLQRYGVYDQARIDAASSETFIQEQYQRLALLHFKFLVHLNSNVAKYMPQASPLTYLTPHMLNVRIPSAPATWDKEARHVKPAKNSYITIGGLLSNGDEALRREAMSSVVAWDFTLGMILGCYLTRGDDGDDRALMQRIDPLLFLHLQFRPH